MIHGTDVSRRTVLIALPLLAAASQAKAWGPTIVPVSMGEPVYRRDSIVSSAKTADLLSSLRKTEGCMRADGFMDETGVISIWQEWVSVQASTAFWRRHGTEYGTSILRKLQL